MNRHVFMPDPAAATWRGEPSCAVCPMPRRHEVHEVPERDDDTERLLGEHEEAE